jgi:DNA-binding NtrC family response regulator
VKEARDDVKYQFRAVANGEGVTYLVRGEAPFQVDLSEKFRKARSELIFEFERDYLERLLLESHMNVSLASRTAGLSRKHLRNLMSKHGIKRG